MLRGCPGSKLIKEARPEYIACLHCQTEIEIWSDEYRVRCPKCQAWTYREQGPTCLDWCKKAEECVGSQALASYEQAKKGKQ